MAWRLVSSLAAVGGLVALALTAIGAEPGGQPATNAAAQNFALEHEIGHRFRIEADDLPAPNSGPVISNRSMTIPFREQSVMVPPRFAATLFAVGLNNPRRLLVLPDGDVLVAEQGPGQVVRLRDDGDGRGKPVGRAVEHLNRPYGLAIRGDELLVADQDAIWRLPLAAGGAGDAAAAAQPLTPKGVFGGTHGHQNRGLAIDPHTGALFVGVGSAGNIGVEPAPKATIQRFAADGGNQTTYASGTRNPTALTFHPTTGELWAVVQERDGLGDNLPADFLIRVQQGGFYGWPYAYIGKHKQPGFAQLAPDKVNQTIAPDLLFQAHSSVLDLMFYHGSQFPAEYRGSLFVAMKGSWNRSLPTGYKVVRVPFQGGRPEGYYENFATGFWAAGEDRAEVFGRPAALAMAKDGALLVADDTNGTIWRIAYTGGR